MCSSEYCSNSNEKLEEVEVDYKLIRDEEDKVV